MTSIDPQHPETARHANGLEVVGCDGEPVGVIDCVEGTLIRLRSEASLRGGAGPEIPTAWIHSIDSKVVLKVTGADAKRGWTDA